jgi:hypothetical protein
MQPDTGGSRSMIITTTENIPEARVGLRHSADRRAGRRLVNTAVWVIVGVVFVVGIVIAVFGWDRYRGSGKATSESSQPTDEVSADPATGQSMRVWYDPATGEREYRPDP